MKHKMTIMGIADVVGVPTFAYLAAAIVLNKVFYPAFLFPGAPSDGFMVAGIACIGAGLIILGVTAVQLLVWFPKGVLITTGFFRIFLNPLYTAWVLFLAPGIGLLFGSWLVMTTAVVMYVFVRIFVRREEEFLREKFGGEYENYRKKVWFKFL